MVDTILVVGAQWLVRQFELYTPYGRKDISILFLYCNLILWMSSSIILVMTLVLGRWALCFLTFLLCFVHLGINTTAARILKRTQHSYGVVPKEIESRRSLRYLHIVITGALVVYFVSPIAPPFNVQDAWHALQLTIMTVIVAILTLMDLLEYLYCTHSLHPDNKRSHAERMALGKL